MRSSASAPEKRAMGSNSASSSTFAFPKRRICGCGGNVVLIKSKTTNNPGRFRWCRNRRRLKKLKVLKLRRSLMQKREGENVMGVAVGSWVLTLIVCVVCVGKCP
ncbi:hypothetical protein SESBI_21820 [Sesbania bispinosa]|nr:hypothetical protein SESBI_21820 [Sesbania bispinosa]